MPRMIHVRDISQIDFDKMNLNTHYLLVAPDKAQLVEARKRWIAAGEAKGWRPRVYFQPGSVAARFIVAPARAEDADLKQKLGVRFNSRPGRPIGRLGEAVERLQVGQHVIAQRDGRTVQTLRNIASRVANRMGRKNRVELIRHGDPEIDWAEADSMGLGEGEFYRITRIE